MMFTLEGLAVSAVAGAIGGGVGWLATRSFRERNKQKADLIAVGITVLFGSVGYQVLAPMAERWRAEKEDQAMGLDLFGNERSARLYAATLGAQARNPKWRQRLAAADPTSARAIGASVSRAGFARLPPEDLETAFDLKRAMAARSEEVCAAFWTGNLSEAVLKTALRALSVDQQRVWIEVTGRALAAELSASAAAPPLAPATNDAMQELIEGLALDEQEAFTTAATTAAPSADLACRAFQATSHGLAGATPRVRALALRLFTNPELAQQLAQHQ